MEDEEERGSDVVALIRAQQVQTATLAADIPIYLYEPAFKLLSGEVVRDFTLAVDGATRTLGLEILVDGTEGFARAKRLVQGVYGLGPQWTTLLDNMARTLGQYRITLGIWGRAGSGDPAISVRFDGNWQRIPMLEVLKRCGIPEDGVRALEAHGAQLGLGDFERIGYRVDSPKGEPWFEAVYRNRPPLEDGDAMAERLVAEAAACGAPERQQTWLAGLLKALRPTNPLDWPVGFRLDHEDGLRPGMSVGTRGMASTTAIALLQPFAPSERLGHVLGAMVGATGSRDRFDEVTLRTRDAEPPEILLRIRGVDG